MYSVAKCVLDPWRDLKISVYTDRNQASFCAGYFFLIQEWGEGCF